jgi:four helix bundle suffix protein
VKALLFEAIVFMVFLQSQDASGLGAPPPPIGSRSPRWRGVIPRSMAQSPGQKLSTAKKAALKRHRNVTVVRLSRVLFGEESLVNPDVFGMLDRVGKDPMKSDGKNGKNATPEPAAHPIIPPRGDYQTLLSYQKAEVIYDLTFRFAHKYLERGDRTIDQMIQSARSGKQNILEGSKAALTSKETELKLTSVGRASLEELLADYRDYLRVRDHAIWDRNCREALYVRRLGCKTPQTYELYRTFMNTRPPEIMANIAISLIHQTNFLIDQQLRRLEKDFLKQGGLRERMFKARLAQRNTQRPS